ncbi:AraC-like DNA-binding protein [Filimonas zeae]|uniref:HTH araC/xylS-type domain-containing protein n=1 Tax=Filimonas zeae TaxID=1737353 RepID=A0A917IP56_9BACT|nr:hypothetical protein [Filimonas zeae]MDR6337396.1 AraC-like DNA-binding protein [Filimonas zeae]GGH58409.1 hypothetical protein GCM10011379_04110 [Filimonas zeae]
MVRAQLPKESTPSLNTFRQVSDTYTGARRLAGADITEYQEWDNGHLLMEGLYCGKQLVQLFALHVRHRERICFRAVCDFTALWYMCTGGSGYVLEGLGNNRLEAGKCALSYLPAHLEHFATYEPGTHVFMCISLLPSHLDAHHPRLHQLYHLEQWVRRGGKRAWQQPVLEGSEPIQAAFESLLTSGKPEALPASAETAIAEYKKLVYQRMQRESIEERHIQKAMELKMRMDTCNNLSKPLATIYQELGIGEYEAGKAFKYLTGQTPAAYLQEQKLLLVRELLWYGGKRVKEVEQVVGLSANNIMKLFPARFGMGTKEFVQRRQKW